MPYTQDNRRIAVDTPLGKDALLLQRFSGQEGISQPFQFTLELLAPIDKPVDYGAIVGKSVTMSLETPKGARHFNGVVSRFSETGADDTFITYRAEVVPWLWLLTLTSDCRIFQDSSPVEIIQKVFMDLGFADFRFDIERPPASREYCVQYRETDFNFVARLMEQYGIFYYFEHKAGKHTLVVTDSHDSPVCPLQPQAYYQRSQGGASLTSPVITEWTLEQKVRPGKYALRDYNFETPSTSLEVAREGLVQTPPETKLEIYDFPGEYSKREEGEWLARIRIEEQEADRLLISGASTCGGFTARHRFDLTDHPRRSMNGSYVLMTVSHDAQESDYRLGQEGGGFQYVNTFTCVPRAVSYRPPRLTPKPVVQGVQTAKVVGPAGEEIWTDKYARVKVQFHWDREGKEDEHSSCWIRVSQPWAGKGWGSMAIPRIGQEVIVDFLEGDPDQPIIVGRVYNAEAMPAVGLPAGQNISGLKSQTVKGGGYNEISMDDTAGKEKITIHGQYDLNSTVEHDQAWTVKNNKTTTVDGTHTETIKKDTKITISEGLLAEKVQNEISLESVTSKVYVKAATEITLEVGASKLTMKSDGKIELKGVDIAVDGSAKVFVHGGEVVSEAVTTHETKGAMVKSEGSAVNTVKGGMVMLNP